MCIARAIYILIYIPAIDLFHRGNNQFAFFNYLKAIFPIGIYNIYVLIRLTSRNIEIRAGTLRNISRYNSAGDTNRRRRKKHL